MSENVEVVGSAVNSNTVMDAFIAVFMVLHIWFRKEIQQRHTKDDHAVMRVTIKMERPVTFAKKWKIVGCARKTPASEKR